MSFVSQVEFDLAYDKLVALETSFLEAKADYTESLNTIWMLLAAMLVFFMHAGFSMLEAGCVRFKNTQNILAKNLVVVTVGFLCWYVLGFGLALGPTKDMNRFTGGSMFFMDGFMAEGNKSLFRVWFFQGAFCATGGTIVSGAMAERTQLKGFGTFTVLMTSIIYPMIVWWCWSGSGFLNYEEDGVKKSIVGPAFLDFAGSGVVHLAGGAAALVGALAVGARKDRWENEDEFIGHNIPFCVLGTFFLWFGWYGFNPGSTGAMKSIADANTAAIVACNTTMGPVIAGLVVFFLRAQVVAPKCLDVGGFCNGILAGLVAVTAGCSVFKPWESCIVGGIAGFLYQGVSMLLRRFKIDDVVDAVPVHGACGLWGIISVGFFGNPAEGLGGNGVFYGGDQLGTQLFAGFIIILWVGILSSFIFFPLKVLGMLRMGDEFQERGADVMEHSPAKAYHIDPDEAATA